MNKPKRGFDPRIRSYAVAAVSGATLIAPAAMDGAVVYHSVNQTIGYGQSIPISFNKRGTADFTVSDVNHGDSYGRVPYISLSEPANGHQIADVQGAPATAFPAGAIIGPSVTFSPVQQALLASGYSSSEYGYLNGPFANQTAFAGVAVQFQGRSFYGWIRIRTVQNIEAGVVNTTVMDYAYQTTPNTPIAAGQGIPQQGAANFKGSLGSLAFGARSVGADPAGE